MRQDEYKTVNKALVELLIKGISSKYLTRVWIEIDFKPTFSFYSRVNKNATLLGSFDVEGDFVVTFGVNNTLIFMS